MRARPKRKELFRAAIELVSNGSPFKATARRYSLCPADAEDAYQRALEILMTKAPSREVSDLAPWLQTVIKHEALAIRRERERMLAADPSSDEPAGGEDTQSPEERAPDRERARRTAEALLQLKPSEVQCLLLKAVGYSYEEISAKTGYSWTKVNRSLSEGRKRFFERFEQIESGKRCGRFRSLLSEVSDGEAAPADERQLKAHLDACPSCRAALRDYRTLPTRVAELLPPAALLPALHRESWWSRLHDTVAVWAADRGGAIGHKLQHVGDAVSAQKATAVVASTAALTGGAVVHERVVDRPESQARKDVSRSADSSPARPIAVDPDPALPPAPIAPPQTPSPDPTPKPPPETDTAGGEFSPEQAVPEPSSSGPTATTATARNRTADTGAGSAPASSTSGNGGPPASGQEFGP